MKHLLVLMAIGCVGVPDMADAGCRNVRRVQHVRLRRAVHQVAGHHHRFGLQAQFVSVEQPVYLSLVAAQKRQELQLAQYQAAVQQGVEARLHNGQEPNPPYDAIVQKLEGLRVEVEKFRKGDTSDTAPPPVPMPAPAPDPNVPPTADPASPAPADNGAAGASADLVKFLEGKCAQCHKGAGAEGGFVLFGDDGAPQLTPGKLIQADLATYSNRMPPKEKLTEAEYGGFRALYQTWEREIREFAGE
jgi:hypothetical protein